MKAFAALSSIVRRNRMRPACLTQIASQSLMPAHVRASVRSPKDRY
jgi:hypothetical protein